MIDFTDIEYLKTGSVRQQHAYRIIKTHRIFEKLSGFDPILAGTIPINIDIDTSDLDVICCFSNAQDFEKHLVESFGQEQSFKIFIPNNPGAVAASFVCDTMIIEIFGQSVRSQEQAAYLHMLVEYKILQEKGEAFRQEIISLKRQGHKTEPAFGKLLGMKGDVYDKLLKWDHDNL